MMLVLKREGPKADVWKVGVILLYDVIRLLLLANRCEALETDYQPLRVLSSSSR